MDSRTRCNTLLFFDIETTGLPTDLPTRITELSFCAIERSQFLSAWQTMEPRVTNCLNLCVKPNREIDIEASKKSGLNADNLKHQPHFDEDTAEIILRFIKRLVKPVCLIAHNGDKFDFPIFKSEFENIGKKLPDDLLCSDSCTLFRTLQFPDIKPRLYNLNAVYHALFKKDIPNAHSAQGDVQALMECGLKLNSKFFEKVDSNAVSVHNIAKLW